jgi:hypothetical protein
MRESRIQVWAVSKTATQIASLNSIYEWAEKATGGTAATSPATLTQVRLVCRRPDVDVALSDVARREFAISQPVEHRKGAHSRPSVVSGECLTIITWAGQPRSGERIHRRVPSRPNAPAINAYVGMIW